MAQKRWCGAAGVEKVKVVSDVLETEFGLKYGLLLKERRYFRRAVFIVGRDGKLTYVNYLPKLADEPNYDEVINAAKEALNNSHDENKTDRLPPMAVCLFIQLT